MQRSRNEALHHQQHFAKMPVYLGSALPLTILLFAKHSCCALSLEQVFEAHRLWQSTGGGSEWCGACLEGLAGLLAHHSHESQQVSCSRGKDKRLLWIKCSSQGVHEHAYMLHSNSQQPGKFLCVPLGGARGSIIEGNYVLGVNSAIPTCLEDLCAGL